MTLLSFVVFGIGLAIAWAFGGFNGSIGINNVARPVQRFQFLVNFGLEPVELRRLTAKRPQYTQQRIGPFRVLLHLAKIPREICVFVCRKQRVRTINISDRVKGGGTHGGWTIMLRKIPLEIDPLCERLLSLRCALRVCAAPSFLFRP